MRTSDYSLSILILLVFAFLYSGTIRIWWVIHENYVFDDSDAPLPPNTNKDTSYNVSSKDVDCPFRDSDLYRSIYVYPSPGDENWKGEILSASAKDQEIVWPWIEIDRVSKREGKVHYDPTSQAVQYTTELLVRDIITHPQSCLRTDNPDEALLFYVPYLPSVEYHNGTLSLGDYKTSPFGQALMDATEGNYESWESVFGLTSKFWRRRGGSDHILVFSEPLHGLWHPKSRRGSFHFIHSQKQLTPPIVISVELSRTFIETYPNCARKNILMPYPNTDGRWFNGKLDEEAATVFSRHKMPLDITKVDTALAAEKELFKENQGRAEVEGLLGVRPLAQFYKAGAHGSCANLRKTLAANFKCTPSGNWTNNNRMTKYSIGYRQSTFCPCPGGDSPSAKRMFDALHSGCIPIVLSHDYVWPFTAEFDLLQDKAVLDETILPLIGPLDPNDFSIRLQAEDYLEPVVNASCGHLEANTDNSDVQSYINSISKETIQKLRDGTRRATELYSYYTRNKNLPDNPLQENILPDGGAAKMLIKALSERAGGNMWSACQEELRRLKTQKIKDATSFQCQQIKMNLFLIFVYFR